MTATHGQAFAATVPIAMTGLAEHIANHHLDTPSQIIFTAPLVGETDAQAVQILLDSRHVDDWLASLDTQTASLHSQHADGMWHDVYGVANAVRVRLSWYTITRSFGPAPVLAVVPDQPVCEVDDDCRAETACPHGRALCGNHLHECTQCVDDARQDRAQGWDL